MCIRDSSLGELCDGALRGFRLAAAALGVLASALRLCPRRSELLCSERRAVPCGLGVAPTLELRRFAGAARRCVSVRLLRGPHTCRIGLAPERIELTRRLELRGLQLAERRLARLLDARELGLRRFGLAHGRGPRGLGIAPRLL